MKSLIKFILMFCILYGCNAFAKENLYLNIGIISSCNANCKKQIKSNIEKNIRKNINTKIIDIVNEVKDADFLYEIIYYEDLNNNSVIYMMRLFPKMNFKKFLAVNNIKIKEKSINQINNLIADDNCGYLHFSPIIKIAKKDDLSKVIKEFVEDIYFFIEK